MKRVPVRMFAALAIIGFTLLASANTSFADDSAAVFKAKCAMCHGPDAAGRTPMGQKLKIPDLNSADVQKMSDAELSKAITKGKDKMPAYEGKLDKEQIDKLVAYLREIAKKH